MVDEQIVARGVHDPRVIAAMREVPREEFVPSALGASAYADTALSISAGQTISQPYIVAVTLAALGLTGGERVLEVGTGSGYVAALLTRLAREVFTIERLPALAASATERLRRLGYAVEVKVGDGTLGWPERAPFDAIAVAAVAPRIPDALLADLAPGGRMVIPVREGEKQVLRRVVRSMDGVVSATALEDVRFVPLIGVDGEPEHG
jgi:protein-L-isoaspartate(D-aspartate) O-methyltransferase